MKKSYPTFSSAANYNSKLTTEFIKKYYKGRHTTINLSKFGNAWDFGGGNLFGGNLCKRAWGGRFWVSARIKKVSPWTEPRDLERCQRETGEANYINIK